MSESTSAVFHLIRVSHLRRGRILRECIDTVQNEQMARRLAEDFTKWMREREPDTRDFVEVEKHN